MGHFFKVIMNKKTANTILRDTWAEMYPEITATPEYKPWTIAYVAENGSTVGIREFMKSKNLMNFALDMAFVDAKIFVEVQGTGGKWSHKGDGQLRDFKKNNQLLEAGWSGFQFSAGEVGDHPKIICRRIHKFLTR